MKKIITFILLFATVLSVFPFSVSAEETITDLTKVHTNLSNYLYTPYYENSKYFEEYQKVMDEAADLLASDDITQAEISKYYNEIRRVYAQLMQDTYDYSSLEKLLETYDALDGSIFTEDTWKKVLSVRDSAKKELDSPSLFSRTESMSDKQYTAYINSHIRSFTTEFKNAFNRLKFKERPENITPEILSAMAKTIRFCSRAELLSSAPSWSTLTKALEEADEVLEDNKPKNSELNESYQAILAAYTNTCNEAYDFADVKETLTKHHILSAKSFSKSSWDRYEALVLALEKRMTESHFFFIPLGADQETCEKYAKDYFAALPAVVNDAQASLIPIEDYDKLENLCKKYKNKTSMEGLDIKSNFLQTRVAEGEAVLANKDAVLQDVETAIKNIETAHNDLVVAEGHLIEEQGKIVKQDEKTLRLTFIFFFASLIPAACIAMILSKMYFGKVNWSK